MDLDRQVLVPLTLFFTLPSPLWIWNLNSETFVVSMDDYAENGGPGEDFYVFLP